MTNLSRTDRIVILLIIILTITGIFGGIKLVKNYKQIKSDQEFVTTLNKVEPEERSEKIEEYKKNNPNTTIILAK